MTRCLQVWPSTYIFLITIEFDRILVDAHVGKALFNEAILGALRNRGKTVILVTHALHFLPQCDYIYTMANGRLGEQGTYDDLMRINGEFARLSREFGGDQEKEEEKGPIVDEEGGPREEAEKHPAEDVKAKLKERNLDKVAGTGRLEGRLIIKETRTTGAVPWHGAFSLSEIRARLLKVLLQCTGRT